MTPYVSTKTMPIAVIPKATAASGSKRSIAAYPSAHAAAPDCEIARAPIPQRGSVRVRWLRRTMAAPDQRQRQRNEDGNEEKQADNGQRQADVVLAVEQYPGGQREPRDESNRARV
jgi:hypothetical protein